MGCWGITALESDAGLDTVGFIRRHLPKDGRLQLEKIVEALKRDDWNAPPVLPMVRRIRAQWRWQRL